jgi:hypothetical protein
VIDLALDFHFHHLDRTRARWPKRGPQMCRGQRLSRGLSGESTRMNRASRWPETNDG